MKTWEQARDEALANLERTHSADQYMIMINKMADFGREWARAEFTDYYGPLIELERTLKEQNKEVYILERAKSEKLLDALEFYADSSSYDTTIERNGYTDPSEWDQIPPVICDDDGYIARDAIAAYKGEE